MHGPAEDASDALIVALPETVGSTLYGMIDILSSAGVLWQELVGAEPGPQRIKPRIVSTTREQFRCGNGIPVTPECAIADDPHAPIVILPEIWLSPEGSIKGRYPELMEWIRRRYRAGAWIYSACSGSIILAESGLLNGCNATSHWAFERLFNTYYPKVKFHPEPNLCFADPGGRIVTGGGTTTWHDLVLHIISRHCSPGEALQIAKVYLLKWHGEGQAPYKMLVKRTPHADAAVRRCEEWLSANYKASDPVARAVAHVGVPERTIKRRFKLATGATLMDHVQNLRIEEAKRVLESSDRPVDEIAIEVGYENPGFFRNLFKRRTGLSPSQYRRMFTAFAEA